MSSSDYVHHMSQKYRLAIAIAVLKSKPKELTVAEYIEKLKFKLNNETMDVDEINVCSEDFSFNEDIFNEFNESFNENECDGNEYCNEVEDLVKGDGAGCSISDVLNILRDTQDLTQTMNIENSSQATNCEEPSSRETFDTREYNPKPTNALCFDVSNNNTDNLRTKKVEMVTKIVKNMNKGIENTISTAINANNVMRIENDAQNITVDATTHEYDINCQNGDMIYSTPEEISQNIKNNEKHDKLVENVRKNIIKIANNREYDLRNNKIRMDDVKGNVIEASENILTQNRIVENIQNCTEQTDVTHFNETETVNTDFINEAIPQSITNINNVIDTQETVIYTLDDLTQTNTHISQSQYDNFQISNALLYGNRNNDNNFDEMRDENSTVEGLTNCNFVNSHENVPENSKIDFENKQMTPMEVTNIQSADIEFIVDKDGKTYRILDGFTKNDNTYKTVSNSNMEGVAKTNIIQKETVKKIDITDKAVINTNNSMNKININEYNTTTQNDKNLEQNNLTQDDEKLQDDCTNVDEEVCQIDEIDSQTMISFKVIEELNKVNSYLNRKSDKREEGFSSDSGYKSDSQSKCSYKSSQPSDGWLNQSAHCLYIHLIQCSLVTITEEITYEISQVIGQLIDHLHEEEKYPSFIEELLDNVDSLVHDLFAGDSSCEDTLLRKEEIIQRLCLLNQSIHILKHTIDKITQVLEKVYTNLTSEEIYEIQNVQEVENVSYILHLLEISITLYLKLKINENNSQNKNILTQSQEEKLLKRSSITEIWRKKWNTNFKEISNSEGRSEKCVLSKCSEVLNKIVVKCIEGYSLISFAALQCFNLMQK